MIVVRLLHLCDSLFPLGSFGYSDGLEGSGVETADDLREWLDVCLDETIGRFEGPAVWRAWAMFRDADWAAVAALDAKAIALRPSSAARTSTRAMGLRLLTTWHMLHPEGALEHALGLARDRALGPSLPIAFGGVCAGAGIGRALAVESYAYTRLAATVSAAMRLMPIGQTAAHTLLARAVDRIPTVAADSADRDLESFSPAMDIAAMRQQHLHSRLFRS